ncbi:DUF2986 domain-containing protein [Shewanella intestini]|uniref:DUF2986 domain-containing protein n=1 Tax=Shewanella intestini TaxID=2017544 RepID=A0ABS5I5Z2_9GAMM|nr:MULTISPECIES: DUF2986 domain-containing protein [Shewanella]MBR9729336.1 DUF2986 domain-containing protein [Shewanella intestini]MRG37415.1 DUF2986 domain-containing protein [Shewanella sp. XMDDZSB0408]
MNRKKKINQTLKAKAKKANSKFHSNGKAKYIAKADRVATDVGEQSTTAVESVIKEQANTAAPLEQ